MPDLAPRALLIAPALVAFLLVAVLVGLLAPTPLPWVIGLVVGLAVAAAATLWLERRAPEAAVRALGARHLAEGEEPRLESLVESVCASHGINEPVLYVVDSPAPDAAVAGTPTDTRLVVTTGALETLDRLELEAVVARELAQFGRGVHAATVLVAVAPFFGPLAPRVRQRVIDHHRLALTDLEGVRLTRYPPALAGAFEKAAASSGVPDRPAVRHLWLIGPFGVADAVQPPLDQRIDTLREL